MSANAWGWLGLVAALVVIYLFIAGVRHQHVIDGKGDISKDEDEDWNTADGYPLVPGLYRTRLIDQPYIVSESTVWDGHCWRYTDGMECYFQRREWQPLPDAVMA